jgi:phosphopantothenoylcysteine decarboxylase/phosphopantothenate--cysteine ligase
MRILITAGATREPIDPVRYIGNRSSGRMGAALASAAVVGGHEVTLISGPAGIAMPAATIRLDVETAAQMHQAVLAQFPAHDLLIMAAAVADFRPRQVHSAKLPRDGMLTIECEPTEDILAAVSRIKRSDQRTIGFSLETEGNLSRAEDKLARKRLDLIVYNPIETLNSDKIEPVLLWPGGQREEFTAVPKEDFACVLIDRAAQLFERQ